MGVGKAKRQIAFHLRGWFFSSELKAIHSAFAIDRRGIQGIQKKNLETEKDYNMEARYMNTLLCDFENDILMVLHTFIESFRRANATAWYTV